MGDTKSIVCPICLKTLTFDAGSTTENDYVYYSIIDFVNILKWEAHFDTECQAENYEKVKAQKMKTCLVPDCKTRLTTLNTYICVDCSQDLCLRYHSLKAINKLF